MTEKKQCIDVRNLTIVKEIWRGKTSFSSIILKVYQIESTAMSQMKDILIPQSKRYFVEVKNHASLNDATNDFE